MVKVVKFGGSSLASAEQFAKVGDIIRADESRKYVVPSAPGKRNSRDTKVTDMLYACYAKAEAGEEFRVPLMKIKERYDSIINGLGLKVTLDEEFKTISKNFKEKAGVDYAASRGEYLNGILMADYLGYEFIDSATVIFFDEEGNLDADKTDKVLSKKLAECEKAVIPGFYGIGADGKVKTFSRGGSDITGSIVAKACHASLYENWTDVSGCLVADPRIIDNPQPIHVITYRELRELSYMGASVLHEDAVFPVRKAGIPINIRNTNDPEAEGTLIVESTCQKPEYTITGIALQRIQISRKCRYQCLTFTCLHLCDTSLMQDNTTDNLYSVMLHAKHGLLPHVRSHTLPEADRQVSLLFPDALYILLSFPVILHPKVPSSRHDKIPLYLRGA